MLTYIPFEPKNSASATGLRGNPLEGAIGPVNVGEVERYGSIIGGAALIATGLSRRSIPGLLLAALGGLFIVRGVGGHCRLYGSIGVSTSAPSRPGVPGRTGHKIEQTLLIARPPGEIFAFWRNLENLPEFMDNLESVRVLDDRHSHWIAKGPGGQRVEWDAEIVNEHPGEMISWQTLPGADVQSAGTVRFAPAENGQSTVVRVVLEYHAPAGALGRQVARLFGKDPALQLELSLVRLKELLESRPVPTIAA